MKRYKKFRAWDIEKQMWIFFCIDLFPSQTQTIELPKQLKIQEGTGLKDKNGKDCYEGDLVRRSEFNDVVDIVYREDWGAFAFHAKHTTGRGEGWSHMYSGHAVHSWEIIGNI